MPANADTAPESIEKTKQHPPEAKATCGQKFVSIIKNLRIGDKAVFFFGNACIYTMHTFALNSFAGSWHLNYFQLGITTGASILNMVGSLVASKINERTKNPRNTLILSTICYALTFLLLFGIQQGKKSGFMGMDKSLDGILGLLVFVLLYSIGNMFSAGIYPSMDVAVLAETARLGASKESFGKQRMWGVIGHSATTIFVEYINEEFKSKETKVGNRIRPQTSMREYQIKGGYMVFVMDWIQFGITFVLDYMLLSFWWLKKLKTISFLQEKGGPETILLVLLSIVYCVIVYFAVPKNVMEYLSSKKPGETKTDKKIGTHLLYANIEMILFFLMLVVMGIARCIITYYLVFYSEAVKHVNKSPLSTEAKPFTIFALAKAGGEVVCYPLEKFLIRLMGTPTIMTIFGIFLSMVRLIGYSVIQPEFFVVLGFFNEVFKGVSSGLFFCGAIRFLRDELPGELLAMAQGVMSAVFMGFSGLIGGIMTGVCLHVMIKKNSSSYKYEVLRSPKVLPEIDARLHLSSFKTFLLGTTITLSICLVMYTVQVAVSMRKKKMAAVTQRGL